MRNPFDRLELLLEDAVEGTAQRMLGARVQPTHLGRACAREMRAGVVVGLDGPVAPNQFEVRLHPTDDKCFGSFRASLAGALAQYLDRLAAHHGWALLGPVGVAISADPTVRRSRVRVNARHVEPALAGGDTASPQASAAEPSDSESGSSLGGDGAPVVARRTMRPRTTRLRAVPRVRPPAPEDGLVLLGPHGERWTVRKQRVAIGRALANDVVLDDERVSRFHAELVRQDGGWALRDLGSTNGTLVAGRPIEESAVQPGQRLSFGGYDLTLQAAESDVSLALSPTSDG